jgi:hypothetical protein
MMAGSNLWEEVVRRSRLWVYMFGDIPFSPDDRRRSVDGSELFPPGGIFSGDHALSKTKVPLR